MFLFVMENGNLIQEWKGFVRGIKNNLAARGIKRGNRRRERPRDAADQSVFLDKGQDDGKIFSDEETQRVNTELADERQNIRHPAKDAALRMLRMIQLNSTIFKTFP